MSYLALSAKITLLATCTDIQWLHYSCTIIFGPLKQLILSKSDNYRNSFTSYRDRLCQLRGQ
jgi:hypothetical protein